ncbi:MAG: diguanylate cyclase [Ruthenibacterium sp.]
MLNFSGAAVLASLGWWSFCDSFFFAAATAEQAMVWHKLSAIGWCGFVACTSYYFLALVSYQKGKAKWWKQILFFTPMLVLIGKNIFGKTTSLAQNIIRPLNGVGWTYENTITSVWLWIYLLYVVVYFGFAFYFLYQWGKSAQHKMKKEMAVKFIVLDIITILFGVVTDVIMPLTNPNFPAIASIGTALFGIGYFSIIYRNDIFNIDLVISSDDILQTSSNLIFVVDENKEILKYNRAVGSLLGYGKSELIGANFMRLTAGEINFEQIASGEDFVNMEVKMCCKDGTVKDVLLSASAAKDKRYNFLCLIISCQDVSKLKKTQAELERAQDKYKRLADDYQELAYYDPLTNLPNRRHLFKALGDFEKGFHENKQDFAVLFLDLDNFKQTNDIHGHKVGDELLIAAARKLKTCMEKDEFVARLGGDEFMIILPYIKTECLDEKMQRIRKAFEQSVVFEGRLYTIEISVGYGVFSQVGNITALMQAADEGMYKNKKTKLSAQFSKQSQ